MIPSPRLQLSNESQTNSLFFQACTNTILLGLFDPPQTQLYTTLLDNDHTVLPPRLAAIPDIPMSDSLLFTTETTKPNLYSIIPRRSFVTPVGMIPPHRRSFPVHRLDGHPAIDAPFLRKKTTVTGRAGCTYHYPGIPLTTRL